MEMSLRYFRTTLSASFLTVALLMANACGAEKPLPIPVTPEADSANEVVAQPEETTTEDSNADPVEGVEWSPLPVDKAIREESAPAIDLDMGEGYEPVHVNGKAPRHQPMKCKTAKDCARMSIPKMPGNRRCINNKCVFVGAPLDGNDIELF